MRWVQQVASQLLSRFAKRRRRVVSDWRIRVEYHRLAHEAGEPAPVEWRLAKVLTELRRAGMAGVPGLVRVYRIDVAFADTVSVSDEQLVQEADPTAVFSHLSALVTHGLTDQVPHTVHVTRYDGSIVARTPLGTSPEDWHGLPLPEVHRPRRVGDVPVRWFVTKGEWDFGHTVGYSQGQPIYVTDLERTVIDALRSPAEVGGAALMLRAWKAAGPSLNLDRLVAYTDRFGQPVLRQRVGYLVEQLGHTHPRLAGWKARLQRGGSLRLVASEPYSAVHSPDWNLSLNVPPAVLAELH